MFALCFFAVDSSADWSNYSYFCSRSYCVSPVQKIQTIKSVSIQQCSNMLHIFYMYSIFLYDLPLHVSCFRERGRHAALSLQKERQSYVLWPKDHEKGWCHFDLEPTWQLVSIGLFEKLTPLAVLRLQVKHWQKSIQKICFWKPRVPDTVSTLRLGGQWFEFCHNLTSLI